MNKEYMLAAVRGRMKELNEKYMYALDNMTVDGRTTSRGGGAVLRSRVKRDICLLALVEELLVTSSAVYITNDDAVLGFERLVSKY